MGDVLADDETIAAMADILVASTGAGREVSGVGALRPATPAEWAMSGLAGDGGWMLANLRTVTLGEATSVRVTPAAEGEVTFHTHPGLRFGMAGFSDGDAAAVQTTGRPLLVIGYTTAAPDTLSWFGVLGGWPGLALGVTVQAALRAEVAGKLDTGLARVGVAARMLVPGGLVLPVRRATAAPWQRAVETGAFQVDQVVARSANVANRWARELWRRVR